MAELIEDAGDPRLDGYRALRHPELRRRIDRDHEIFVAEGTLVLQALVASRYRVRSVLVAETREATVAPMLVGVPAPLYVASPAVLRQVAGFDLHRGVVALGERQAMPCAADVLAASQLVMVLEGVNDHENLGALFRNAAAFGVDAVLLDPTTADPLYRRCLRVSMGHALAVPTARLTPWPDALQGLARSGWTTVALTPAPDAEPIDMALERLGPGRLRPPVALLVGAEGPGLTAGALGAADLRVRIPMVAGVDSLNVATAAAIALHRLSPVPLGARRAAGTSGP